jgi:glycogen debranching enzyme
MDAKVGDWVVTPRQGKAVEINALWYNALAIVAELVSRFGQPGADVYRLRAVNVKNQFRRIFWNEDAGGLHDYVDGDYRDEAIRPNQIFALSLPFPLFEGERAEQILNLVEEKLYTPVGLRSLSPDHPAYRLHYGGDQLMRDSAYHQGTVWNWLLGPYVAALIQVRGTAAREEARSVLEAIKPHFFDGGIGTISEIFDAAPPELPRGCIAQAWSVGEILRGWIEDAHGGTHQENRDSLPRTRRSRMNVESLGMPAS